MNKYIKLMGTFLIAVISITAVGIGLTNKEENKAADFSHNVAIETNGSDFRGGALR
ncbi:hypothetical protein [Xylocopilactobacillus apis]|nr:hypothetical protein [Xylocopilactobacillus apis]